MPSISVFTKRFLVCGVAVVGLSSGAAHGLSGPIYLQFNGIKGDVQQVDHMNWIDVQDVTWGVTRQASIGIGPPELSRPIFADVTWRQRVDQSVPALFDALATQGSGPGKHLTTATVDFTGSCGAKLCTYFQMSFTDPLLTKLDLSGSSGDQPTIDGAFAYAAIKMTYWGIDAKGNLGAHPIVATYDLLHDTGSLSGVASVFSLGMSGPTVVPEPGTALLLGVGLVGLGARRRRWRRE